MIGPLQQYVSVLQQPIDMTGHFFVVSQTRAPIGIASFNELLAAAGDKDKKRIMWH